MVPTILLYWDLDVQQGLFKLTMKLNNVRAMAEVVVIASNKANPVIVNPFIRFVMSDSCITTLVSFFFRISTTRREMAMVHVLGFMEDECYFNSISFLKNKMCNQLNGHLQLVVTMKAQFFFTLDTFPYKVTYNIWAYVLLEYGRG
jgi:hypothetical protein